jgi:hypothetical protein
LIVGGVLALFIIGGIAQAISKGDKAGPSPSPGPPSFSPGPSGPSGSDTLQAFLYQANGNCSAAHAALVSEYNSGNYQGVLTDTQNLIYYLGQLGSLPNNSSGWELAMRDLNQALASFNSVGPQGWLIEISAAANQFDTIGVQECGALDEGYTGGVA